MDDADQTSDPTAPGYRCRSCGNLTRFDIVVTRRTREFHHYTVAGELEIEERKVLDRDVESVQCRWCGPAGEVAARTGTS